MKCSKCGSTRFRTTSVVVETYEFEEDRNGFIKTEVVDRFVTDTLGDDVIYCAKCDAEVEYIDY